MLSMGWLCSELNSTLTTSTRASGWPRTISDASRNPLKAAAHPIKPISVRRTVSG